MDASESLPNTERCTVDETARAVSGAKANKRWTHATRRPRKYLHEDEVMRMIKAVRPRNRHGVRDAAIILAAYRHGLRVSEIVSLRWDDIDFQHSRLHVRHGGTQMQKRGVQAMMASSTMADQHRPLR